MFHGFWTGVFLTFVTHLSMFKDKFILKSQKRIMLEQSLEFIGT